MKNKKLVLGLTFVATLSYFGSDLGLKKLPPNQKAVLKKIRSTALPAVTVQTPLRETRAPANSTQQIPETPPTFEGTPHPSLPKGFVFVENISAVKESEYKQEYGTKVEARQGHVFFRASEQKWNTNLVVLDTRNQKLHLVSSVIKLEEIDERQRYKILASGLEEHYYNEDLRIMYVQSSQEDLLKTHEDLRGLKVSPQLEIIRGHHKAL